MSTVNRIFETPIGRTAVISVLIAAFLGIIAILIPLATLENDPWYRFLYLDVELPEDERFNLGLVLLESLVLTLFYLFLTIFMGSLAELQNRLPSWGEVFFAGGVTLIAAFFLTKLGIGDVAIEGSTSALGFNHFTGSMQSSVFWFTFIGMILMTLYLMYSQEPENK